MSVFRIHKSKNYTVMSNYHFKDKDISLKAIGLLSKMLSLPEDWDYSIEGLASISKDGKASVQSALQELEKAGYVKRTIRHDSQGHFKGYNYDIYEMPHEVKANIIEQETNIAPYTDFPLTGNPLTENRPQLNTKELNTKKYICKKDTLEYEAKKNDYKSYEQIIEKYIDDKDVHSALLEYIRMRALKRNMPTNYALELCIKKLLKLSSDSVEQIEIIENSIRTGICDFKPLLKSVEPKVKSSKGFNNFSQRQGTDFDAIEQKMTGGTE